MAGILAPNVKVYLNG